MPPFAPPSCHCFEATDSTIRFTGRRFNSTRGRDGPSISECMTSGTQGLKVSMLTSATPPVFVFYRSVQQAYRQDLAS